MTQNRLSAWMAALILLASNVGAAPSPAQRSFIDEMVTKYQFDRSELTRLLAQAKRQQPILDAISRPAEGLPWWKYRQIFIKPVRVNGGVDYWNQNHETLARAEKVYGVPAEIIVAIIGVETLYGRHPGKHRVLDALNTLGFYYPKRGKFFRKELGEFLLLTREESVDPLSLDGSYAGAMGKPQFIPSSYRAYAVDFDSDGFRDIWNNDSDVIGSVGNYLAQHGWRRGEDIALRARNVSRKHQRFIEAGMLPDLSVELLENAGVEPEYQLPKGTRASLVELELEDGREHWLGLRNFYVITRYNHSNLYAMAVYQLSRQIKARRDSGLAGG